VVILRCTIIILIINQKFYVAEAFAICYTSHGIRRASPWLINAPLRVVVVRVDTNTKSNVPRNNDVTQIAVEYYLEIDEKKAIYFQKKLNGLVVKSLDAPSVEKM